VLAEPLASCLLFLLFSVPRHKHVLSTHPLTKPAVLNIHLQATHFVLLSCRCGVVWRALGSANVPVAPTLLAAPRRRPTEMVPLPPPPLLPPRPSSSLATPPLVVLYIVRHGESTGNRDGVLQGQRDYPLTKTGRRQAEIAGRRIRQEAGCLEKEEEDATSFFQGVYASDLSR